MSPVPLVCLPPRQLANRFFAKCAGKVGLLAKILIRVWCAVMPPITMLDIPWLKGVV